MNLPNFYVLSLCIFALSNLPVLDVCNCYCFQMCVIVFVSVTMFNVQISPTFCEKYINNQ